MGYASGKINAYLRAGLPVITNRYTKAETDSAISSASTTLTAAYQAPRLKGPLNLSARRQAGFTTQEMAQWGEAAPGPADQ